MKDEIFVAIVQAASRQIQDAAKEDIISYGWLRQNIKNIPPEEVDFEVFVKAVISDLLTSGIQIGNTYKAVKNNKGYTGFRAWKGTVQERIERAYKVVDFYLNPFDRDWAFCFVLPQNVDEHETT
jgi:hypothetical protein